ncbi:hypothetical protein FHG87_006219 [Trinorchestia longiramus]|nr:hypothetical protein FHG87_006219 [Trinorchestia longiramus]
MTTTEISTADTTSETTAAAMTAETTATAISDPATTAVPLQGGLHPTGNERCGTSQRPIGAYQEQVQNSDGSTSKNHYILCEENNGNPFRAAITGDATMRSVDCTSSNNIYAGFYSGSGPCAPLVQDCILDTTDCFSGDDQGTKPTSVPQTAQRYKGCRGVNNKENYVMTALTTTNEGTTSELNSIKCCYAGPC